MIELRDLLAANPDAHVVGPSFATSFESFCFDSRIVQPGQLFLAVKTGKADGHDYAAAACLGGATGVLGQRPLDVLAYGATCIVVPDTEIAILNWARYVVGRIAPHVVAVTGSVGKTTTKELIAHVLGGRLRVFRNPANYSGRFGLPIALGGLRADHQVAVLEMATDHFGEISMMAGVAPPEVACVTRVAAAHLSALGDLDGVEREKGDLVAALKEGGLAVLNADDPRVAAMRDRTAGGVEVVTCAVARSETMALSRAGDESVTPSADLVARNVRVGRDGTAMVVDVDGRSVELRVPWLGRHFATAVLFAMAVGRRFGLSADEVAERVATLPYVPGRLRPLPGRDGALIIDDSYNASPAAVMAALDVLDELRAAMPRAAASKQSDAGVASDVAGTASDFIGAGGEEGVPPPLLVGVLGDMAELGAAAIDEHRRVGRRAAEVVDVLVTRGEEAAGIAEGARAAGMAPERVIVTYRTEDAAAAVGEHMRPGTIVLAKGSAVTRMERVVAALMAEPERAAELLVRQDDAWLQIVVMRPERPTWLEIDLGALAHNTRLLRGLAGNAVLMAVIKGDAYGHGGEQVARTALLNGALWLGVACLPEGAALRAAGIDAPILLLGYTPAWQAREAVRLGLDVAVFDMDTAMALSAAALAVDTRARVHIKVDTGLRRLGVAADEAVEFIAAVSALPEVDIAGVFTHFAVADEVDQRGQAATAAQVRTFDALLAELDARGLRPPLAHAANSAALLGGGGALYDMVRPGIALYGLAPSTMLRDPDLRPVLAWKTQVAQVRDVEPGEAVGYGLTWRATQPSRIATIPVGYADGFRRAPTRWSHVLVRGGAAPLVGRVSMDQASIDVTSIPDVRQGDEVVLIGRQGEREISAEQVADWLGTINYEVVSAILARVSRVS